MALRLFCYIPRCLIIAHVKFKMPNQINLRNINVYSHNYFIANCIRCLNTRKNKEQIKIMNTDIDDSKARIVSQLNFQCHDDAEPFKKLPLKTLLRIRKTTVNDTDNGYCKNRLYYIAEHLKCPSSHLSMLLAKRTFIYSFPFDWLKKSLNILLEMGVSRERILRDLWVLKYHHATIEERLNRVKSMGGDNLYPWMVRCSERILNRSISISQETKTILGEIKSTKMYLANRLNTTPEAVEEMYFKIPALKRIRASKAKNFLDFLIKEGFEIEDIANKPRVLSASQETVMQRLDKLRKLGLKEINLNVLCRSRKDFKKYCESLESASSKG